MKFEVNRYFENNSNVENFLSSLSESYKNPVELFNRIKNVNNLLFISTNSLHSEIEGYLFFNDQSATENLNNKEIKFIYNGFALINQKYRRTNSLKNLLEFSAQHFKEMYGSDLLFYAVTSNPIALKAYYNIFPQARPKIEENISDFDFIIAQKLKEKLFIKTEAHDYPFTFKTELPQRYNSEVIKTFANSHLKEFDFLNQLNVNEKYGDRFLFYWQV